MHPVKRGIVITLLMFVFSIFGLIYITLEFSATDRAFAKLKSPSPLADYSVTLGEEQQRVFIDEFQSLGEPMSYARDNAREGAAFYYLPVHATALDGDGGDDVFILYCRDSDLGVDELAARTSFKGTLMQPEVEQGELSELQLAIQAEYPQLDPRGAAMVYLHTPIEASMNYILWGAWGYSALTIPFLIVWYRGYLKNEQKWLDRIAAFKRSEIKTYPKAVRLVHGDPTLAPSSLIPRSIDPAFDVPAAAKKKYPKGRIRAWRIMAGVVSIGVAAAAQVGLVYVDTDWANGFVAKICFPAIFGFGQILVQAGIASINKSSHESPVQKKRAGHRQTAFHQYHAKVLKELGFRDIGDYRRVSATASDAARTIYLSPQGNTLVAVGGFFGIVTLTNDGKVIETCSQSVKYKVKERLDPNARHLRRGADIEDILSALDQHDDFVAERTYGGSVLEAQFTEERFERFLAWADYKANDPLALKEVLNAS